MKKISTIQICSIAYCLILSNNIGLTTHILFHYCKQNTIISILLGFLLGLIPLFIYLKIMNTHKDKDIFSKIDFTFPKFGKIINFILFIGIAYLITINLYNLINFISSQYLSKTPSFVISFAFLPPIVYILSKGTTVIGRTTFILVLISLSLLFFTVIGLVWQIRLENILPLLNVSFKETFATSLIYVLYNICPLFLLTTIPMDDIIDKEKFNKRMIFTYIIASIVIFTIYFLTISVLGPNLTNLYQYPEYDVLKKVSIIGFFERTESTISLRWIFYIFTTTVMGVKYLRSYISHIFKIKNVKTNNKLTFIITLFIIIYSNYIFKNSVSANIYFYYKLPYISALILILIPFILILKKQKV